MHDGVDPARVENTGALRVRAQPEDHGERCITWTVVAHGDFAAVSAYGILELLRPPLRMGDDGAGNQYPYYEARATHQRAALREVR
ncbi:MAG: hypothetical protein ACHQ4H_14955 [Ktedonobacterales bacterium]